MTSPLLITLAFAMLAAYAVVVRLDIHSGSLLTPLRIWAALGVLTTVPYLLLLGAGLVDYSYIVTQHIRSEERSALVAKFVFLSTACIAAFLVGYRSAAARSIGTAFGPVRLSLPNVDLRIAAVLVLVAGALLWSILIVRLGGLWTVVTNLRARNELFAGFGYLFQAGAGLMTLGVLLGVFSIGRSARPRLLQVAFWVIVAILVAAALSVSGGRKGTIHLAISAMLIWHYCVRPIRRLSLGVLFGGLLLFIYFVTMLVVRTLGGIDVIMDRPDIFLQTFAETTGKAFANLSYVDIYLFIIHWFDRDALWFGSAFADLLHSWAPSAWYPDKPPIDDGRYIMSLLEGWRVSPGMATRQLYPSSLPPETLGAGFMNFGYIGAVVFHYFLGVMVRAAETWMEISEFGFFSVVIFAHVLLNFEISNLRLVQFVITVVTQLAAWGALWVAAAALTNRPWSGKRQSMAP